MTAEQTAPETQAVTEPVPAPKAPRKPRAPRAPKVAPVVAPTPPVEATEEAAAVAGALADTLTEVAAAVEPAPVTEPTAALPVTPEMAAELDAQGRAEAEATAAPLVVPPPPVEPATEALPPEPTPAEAIQAVAAVEATSPAPGATATPAGLVIEVEAGALTSAPCWEAHSRGKNWLAAIHTDPKSPSGLGRKFCDKARGAAYFYLDAPALVVGAAVEFGADYYTGSGRPMRERWYGLITARTATAITLTQTPTAAAACKASALLRAQLAALDAVPAAVGPVDPPALTPAQEAVCERVARSNAGTLAAQGSRVAPPVASFAQIATLQREATMEGTRDAALLGRLAAETARRVAGILRGTVAPDPVEAPPVPAPVPEAPAPVVAPEAPAAAPPPVAPEAVAPERRTVALCLDAVTALLTPELVSTPVGRCLALLAEAVRLAALAPATGAPVPGAAPRTARAVRAAVFVRATVTALPGALSDRQKTFSGKAGRKLASHWTEARPVAPEDVTASGHGRAEFVQVRAVLLPLALAFAADAANEALGLQAASGGLPAPTPALPPAAPVATPPRALRVGARVTLTGASLEACGGDPGVLVVEAIKGRTATLRGGQGVSLPRVVLTDLVLVAQ